MEILDFLAPEISQSDLATFAENKVNLKREHAQRYRAQVNNLRDNLDRYMSEHPDLGLTKMVLSGSLAKGTALRTINDVDVAVYVKGDSAPEDLGSLLQWLAQRLRRTYPQIAPENIKVDGPCVVISFAGTGIDVDVAPVYYLGDPQWRGYLWDRMTGERVLTSIPQHLDFIRRRKDKQPAHFVQVIRLLKWWLKQRQRDDSTFSMRSFLIELLMAKLCDDGYKFADYHAGLEHFFLYIQKTGLKSRVAFSDYYRFQKLPAQRTDVVEVFDPVNPENNVAFDFTESARRKLVQLAAEALDALSYARTSQTKIEALGCWRELMGSSFDA